MSELRPIVQDGCSRTGAFPGVQWEELRPVGALNIVFVTIADLPEGGGHTSRMRAMVKALSLSGHRVSIWNEHGLGLTPETTQEAKGYLDGARYHYVLGTVRRGHGFGSLGTKLRAVQSIAKGVLQAKKQGKIDLIVFNHLSFYDTYPLTLLAKRLGIPTVQAYEDERLELVSKQHLSISTHVFAANSWLADQCCPRMANAIIVISTYLKEKYERLSNNPRKVYLVPTIVDCEVWKCGDEEPALVPTLLYSGCFGEQDDIEKLIEALAILRLQGFVFRMVMLGDNVRDPDRMRTIRALVEQRQLSSVIELRGYVSIEEVQRQVRQATILVSIRRDGVWTRAGMSSKLGEYLASGRMTITSDVGESTKYLKKGENAILLPPTARPQDIAAALAMGLSSPELRNKIGAAGQQLARQNFDLPVAGAIFERVLSAVMRR